MNRLPRLLIQFPQVRQAQAANVELAACRLADGKACDPQVIVALSVAAHEFRCDEIRQKAVNRADGQPRESSNLLGGQSSRRLSK
jgi:hypothetical protein